MSCNLRPSCRIVGNSYSVLSYAPTIPETYTAVFLTDWSPHTKRHLHETFTTFHRNPSINPSSTCPEIARFACGRTPEHQASTNTNDQVEVTKKLHICWNPCACIVRGRAINTSLNPKRPQIIADYKDRQRTRNATNGTKKAHSGSIQP